MERVMGMDAAFLATETAAVQNHVVGVVVVDPTDAVGGFSIDGLRQLLLDRLHLIPPFRRTLVTVPFSIADPLWMEDPDFDIENHLRHAAVPAPGTMHQLADLVGDLAGRLLDRGKPLWEMHYVEGLEEGRVALVTKVHHSCIDGVSGADLMVHLFDLQPEVAVVAPPARPFTGEARPSDLDLVGHALASTARRPKAVYDFGRGLFSAARNLVGVARSNRGEGPPATLPFSSPRTPLNGTLTPHRSVAFGSCTLADLRVIKTAFGCKVNDVVLAATAGALRDYLAEHGGVPDKPLVAVCPVSVRAEGDTDLGTKVSSMFVALPVQEPDPATRLRIVAETTKGSKEVQAALGAELLQQMSTVTPPGLANLAARLISSSGLAGRLPPPANLIVSNVPGPPIPLYCAGARVVATYPMGPLQETMGLNVTVLSNMGNVDVGAIACRELVPDLWDVVDAFSRHVDLLVAAAAS